MFKWLKGSDSNKFVRLLENFLEKKVENVMSKEVITIRPEESLVNAANLLISNHVSCLVVLGRGSEKPIGIMTERDFLTKAPPDNEKLGKMTVRDLMTRHIITIQPSLSIKDANDIMTEHHFRKLVVTEKENMVGILTQSDLVREIDEFYQRYLFRTSDSVTVKDVQKDTKIQKKTLFGKATESIESIHKKLVNGNTGTCFIKEKDKAVGMFTEFDYLSLLASNPKNFKKRKIKEVMSYPITALNGEIDIFDANHVGIERGFRRMPVLEKGEVIGKITQTSLRQHCFDFLLKTRERARKNTLKKVNFEYLKQKPRMVRNVKDMVEELRYAD